MNKTMKITAGLLLGGIALFGAVAPASAQTPGTAIGTLAQGTFKLDAFVQGAQPTLSATGSAVVSMPAVGATGTISSGGLCLDYAGAGEPIAVVCNGSANQLFSAERGADGSTFSLNAVNRPVDTRRLTLGSSTTEGKLILRSYTTAGTPWLKSGLTASHSSVSLDGASGGLKPTFSGVGEPGLTVEVRGQDGTLLGTATVAANGTWSAQSTVDLPEQSYTVTAVQNDGTDTSTDDLTFTVVAAPVADPLLAGGAGMLLVVGAAAVYAAKRRRTAQVTS
ncbi:Ig-like domain-containing protein [Microbacterium phyllosphaerae]|uniref:Ig-like domain-containing protein n=1 Tax=Microbacterium phyllosphaerae TaxID=124798 RepID=UPI00216A5B47|nr:Ig-like domain-containing protein [Microbacterium phyllosphaerae]MCS3442583.1 hypothetical protein [Microbacterium phyllosphaerae]